MFTVGATLRNGYSLNPSHPLNNRRIAWWLASRQQFGTTQWYDLVRGTANKGTFSNFAAGFGWSPDSNPGGSGSILLSNSGTNVVDFGNQNWFSGVSAATWSFWLRINSNVAGRVLTQWGSTGAADLFDFEILTGPQFQVAFSDGGGANFYVGRTGNLTVGQWYRVVVTFHGSPSGVNAYFNGQSQSLTPTSSSTFSTLNSSPTTNIQLGHTADGTTAANVNVNDIGFYPVRVLSLSEIAADYQLSQLGYPGVLNRYSPVEWSPPTTIAVPSKSTLLLLGCGA